MKIYIFLLLVICLLTGCSHTDFLQQAQKARDKNDLPLALEIMNKAIHKDPAEPLYLLERGRLYREMKQYDAALHDFTRLSCGDFSLVAYLETGITFYEKGEYRIAREYLEDFIHWNYTTFILEDRKEMLPQASYWIGRVYLEDKEYEMAYNALRYAAIKGFAKAAGPFGEVADYLGWPSTVPEDINEYPAEIQFADGSSAFLTQELPVTDNRLDYELVSVEPKQLEVDYFREDFRCQPSIFYFLCRDYFVPDPYHMSDYYEVVSEGKQIGLFRKSIRENEKPYLLGSSFQNPDQPLPVDVWLWKFRKAEKEICFITGIPLTHEYRNGIKFERLQTLEEAKEQKLNNRNFTDYQFPWQTFLEEGILVLQSGQQKIKIIPEGEHQPEKGIWLDKEAHSQAGFSDVLKYAMRDSAISFVSSIIRQEEFCDQFYYSLKAATQDGACRHVLMDGNGKVLLDAIQGEYYSVRANAQEVESCYTGSF